MERILREIRLSEMRTGKPSSAVLVIDLQGLKFQSSLVGFISGKFLKIILEKLTKIFQVRIE